MKKYQGTRGVRDYAREAAEMKKPLFVLGLICALTALLAGGLIFYARFFAGRDVHAAAVVPAFAESSVDINILDTPYLPPLIVMCRRDGVFFDTYSNKIIFDSMPKVEIYYNYYRRTHTLYIEGIDFHEKTIPLLSHDILPMRISQKNGEITIRTRRGAFIETGGAYIQILDPRERYHTIIIVDAGHGGIDTGAPNVLGRHAPDEAEIVLAISQKVLEIFDEPGVLVIPTRTCDYFLSTAERARIANSIGDYFISIHNNADSRSRNSRGMLTLYGTAPGSHELADAFQNALIYTLQAQDRGIHYAPQFHILRESRIPVVLLELLFLSNPTDAAQISDPAVKLQTAQTIAEVMAALPPAR